MSFLMSPKLAFAGRFLSDVSTINNLGGDDGWNPQGGGAFEFLNCKVSGGWLPAPAKTDDPVLGFAVAGRPDRSSAKMVDLDPDWQMASQLWALWVRVFDPATGELAFMGSYQVASFRDIWLRQVKEVMQPGGPPNGMPMGARYVSTLRDLTWGLAAERSELLARLREASPDTLSISLHQFGYFYATNHPRYRTATLVGVIGPHAPADAETALVGRRLQGVPLNAGLPCLGMIDVEVAASGTSVSMDLGHALPIDSVDGDITNLGQWAALPQLAGCRALVLGLARADFSPWAKPAVPIEVIGEVDPFSAGWYPATGGVVEFSLTESQLEAIKAAPLALYGRMADGDLIAITRETLGGLFVRADAFVFRMEPGDRASATIHVRRYGAPAAGVTVYLTPQNPPVPPALGFPAQAVSDGDGVVIVTLEASDPGDPRKGEGGPEPSPDGQVYILDYSPLEPTAGKANRAGTGLIDKDVLAIHVRQKVDVPDAPTWEEHVQPILADYAALYPIMSKHLFNIADYDSVVAHRTQLRLAFSRDIDDPNYMPVTRDLSEGKRAIIKKWLADETGDPQAPLRRSAPPGPASPLKPLASFVAKAPTPAAHDAKRDDVAPFEPTFSLPATDGHDDQG